MNLDKVQSPARDFQPVSALMLGILDDYYSGGYNMSVQICLEEDDTHCCEVNVGDTSSGQVIEKNNVCGHIFVGQNTTLTVS